MDWHFLAVQYTCYKRTLALYNVRTCSSKGMFNRCRLLSSINTAYWVVCGTIVKTIWSIAPQELARVVALLGWQYQE